MTKQNFDNYRFSKKTMVKIKEGWFQTSGVWFTERRIQLTDDDVLIDYSQVESINEGINN